MYTPDYIINCAYEMIQKDCNDAIEAALKDFLNNKEKTEMERNYNVKYYVKKEGETELKRCQVSLEERPDGVDIVVSHPSHFSQTIARLTSDGRLKLFELGHESAPSMGLQRAPLNDNKIKIL